MATLFFGGFVHAMENNTLQPIQKWQDAEPFADKIVAYKAKTYWLNNECSKYTLPSFSMSYAYIDKSSCAWTDRGRQFTLRQLYKINKTQQIRYLEKDTLSKEFLEMREITAQEAKEIIEALNSQKAQFSCMWDDEKKILSQLELIAQK